MTSKRIYYWDASCFISLLSAANPLEKERALICEDILKHARNDEVEIWTSVLTIVEVLRPNEVYQSSPLPAWSKALEQTDQAGLPMYPKALAELQIVWDFWKRHTLPSRRLSADQAKKIRGMFAWPFIRKVQIDPIIAERASDLAQEYNIKAADSLHVASALARKCEQLHCWDRDYRKTDRLIPSAEPTPLSSQAELNLDHSSGFLLS